MTSMKRRQFLKSSLLATSVAAMSPSSTVSAADAARPAAREYYELRRYHLRRGPMQKQFDDFYREVALPAWNRAGVRPVGVFDLFIGTDIPSKYVLLPFTSLEAMIGARETFEKDPMVQNAEFTRVPPASPAYIRKASSLMASISGIPRLEVPPQMAGKSPRIFELRTYEAHSRRANLKKIEMFNVGEIEIFRRTGLTPVFFGDTLVGTGMPNLTYMLVFDDMATRDRNWASFVADPEWKKLSTTPGYTDPEILTNITSAFLRPTSYSQI